MIPVDTLLYEIDQRLNKLATNAHQGIELEDKILAINNAQIELVLGKIDPNNVYKLGFDAFKKRYQDLQNLVENPEDHEVIPVLSDKYLNKYIALTDSLPEFMFYVDSYLVADKGDCKDRVLYTNADLVKHADITLLLTDSNYKPSFEYQETIVDISESELHVYTDGTFTPKKWYISYIRYPQKVDKEGYVDFDGKDSVNQDCELEAYLKNELLDIVVEKLAQYTENISAANSAAQRQTKNE